MDIVYIILTWASYIFIAELIVFLIFLGYTKYIDIIIKKILILQFKTAKRKIISCMFCGEPGQGVNFEGFGNGFFWVENYRIFAHTDLHLYIKNRMPTELSFKRIPWYAWFIIIIAIPLLIYSIIKEMEKINPTFSFQKKLRQAKMDYYFSGSDIRKRQYQKKKNRNIKKNLEGFSVYTEQLL